MRRRSAKLTPDEIKERTEGYFRACDESRLEYVTKSGIHKVRQTPYTMIGLANALGIARSTLYAYLDGEYPSDSSKSGEEKRREVERFLQSARGKVEQQVLELAAMGDMDTRIAQLMMHAWGYNTRQEKEDKDDRGTMRMSWEGVSGEEAETWSE